MKAFPFSVMTYDPNHPDSPRYTTTYYEGMDLRDYFAAKAMQEWVGVFNPKDGAERAYEWADAMMEARK